MIENKQTQIKCRRLWFSKLNAMPSGYVTVHSSRAQNRASEYER